MTDLPRVSVILPAYNREAFIADAIRSLQRQADVDLEMIVVDDGSTDNSTGVVRALAQNDGRLRLIEAAHGGVSRARNIGVEAAAGDFITFLDTDDLFAPNRLARQIAKLRGDGSLSLITGHNQVFSRLDDNATPILDVNSYRRTDPSLGSAVFPRSLFDEFGTFDEGMDMGEDLDFFLRLFEADARVLVEKETVYFIRRHQQNMTNDESAMYRGVLRAYKQSIDRRRASGRTEKLRVFFHRPFDREVVIGGAC